MNIIKLSATESTNGYLKELTVKASLKNYTVVVAEYQSKGRGQMGTVWLSDNGKNLTFSFLVKFYNFNIVHQFYLSMAVSLGVLKALKSVSNSMFFIKWPNDILAEKDKIAGILIENIIGGNLIKQSVIGIGLNVNQEYFHESIKNVTSLKSLMNSDLDKDKLMLDIISSIKFYVELLEKGDFIRLKDAYMGSLFKFNIPTMFIDYKSNVFLGKIIDISEEGKLVVELENETTRKFSLKEIKFASR